MGTNDNITAGRLVIAKAGRDKGSVFVATELRQGVVFIADGKRRKLEKPKRKNMKHISPVGDTLICLDGMTNKMLRKLLAQHSPNAVATQHLSDAVAPQYRPNTEHESTGTAETTENLRKGD